MDVPLCADCFKRVSRGLQIKIAYLVVTGGLLLLALMPKFEMNFFVFLIGIFLMVGFAIPVNMINRWLKMEFAKVEIGPVLGAQVTFLHPEYQKLFLQANPVEVAKQRSMQQAALQYLSKNRK